MFLDKKPARPFSSLQMKAAGRFFIPTLIPTAAQAQPPMPPLSRAPALHIPPPRREVKPPRSVGRWGVEKQTYRIFFRPLRPLSIHYHAFSPHPHRTPCPLPPQPPPYKHTTSVKIKPYTPPMRYNE